jgi:hypothetical protein
MKNMSPQATKKRQRKLSTEAPLRFTPASDAELLSMMWVPIRVAVQRTNFSRSTLLRIVSDPRNGCRKTLVKSNPNNQTGRVLLHLPDLINFFSKQAEESQKASANLEGALR